MKRLYSDPPKGEGHDRGSAMQSTKDYLTKIATLVPAEIIAVYLAATAIIPGVKIVDQELTQWVIFFILLIFTPIYFYQQAWKTDPKVRHMIISTLAFTIWVYATKGETLTPEYYDEALAGLVVLVFTIVSGAIPMPEKEEGDEK